jgi:hypothetical protein
MWLGEIADEAVRKLLAHSTDSEKANVVKE